MNTQTEKPIYVPSFISNPDNAYQRILDEVAWIEEQERRRECFMAHQPTDYQYLPMEGAPVYHSGAYHPLVEEIEQRINAEFGCSMNLCFLNHYAHQRQALGWHADDADIIDQTQPIVVVSLGAVREIWTRPSSIVDGERVSHKGEIPHEWRYTLENGSVFIMPPGFQNTHQHRIPKGDREMDGRISLTYRSGKF